jgi:hypothetical protein
MANDSSFSSASKPMQIGRAPQAKYPCVFATIEKQPAAALTTVNMPRRTRTKSPE